jgi:hypothetical protein
MLIRGSPDHRDSQLFLAKRAEKAGDLESALVFLKRALKMDPDFQPAKDLMAEIEAKR